MTASPKPRAWGRRHGVLAMCFLAMFIAYSDRVNISVAAVAMLEEFHWSQTLKGSVLSAFFVGYLLFMIPSGWLAARFGGKRVLGWSVIWWSVFTLLTPWAAAQSISMLFAIRIGLGIGEAAVMPAVFDLLGRWMPAGERSRAMTRFLSGIPMGQIVGFIATGWLVGSYGWPATFYVFGVIGFLWALPWLMRFANDPLGDKHIGVEERQLLAAHDAEIRSQAPTPVGPLLLKLPVWAVFVSHFANNWTLYLLIAWLPSYFHAMGLNYGAAGIYSAAPWLAAFVIGNGAAILADRAIARGVSRIRVRKTTVAVSLLGAALFLWLVHDVHTPLIALGLVCAATGCLAIGWSGFAPNLLDIAPCHGGILISFSNTLATVPGIAGVAITGWLLDRTGTYSTTLMLSAGIAVAGALFYLTFARAQRIDC